MVSRLYFSLTSQARSRLKFRPAKTCFEDFDGRASNYFTSINTKLVALWYGFLPGKFNNKIVNCYRSDFNSNVKYFIVPWFAFVDKLISLYVAYVNYA